MLERFADDVFVTHRPLRFLGVETGTRMTVIRLAHGGLFVHSPVALDAATRTAVDALGTVKAIVAPSLFHHLYIREWANAYPDASVSACPGLEAKRSDLAFDGVLGDEPRGEWEGELDQVFFRARSFENEVVFFHRKSRTVVCSDFVFNLATHPSRFTRFVASALGQRRPGVTLLERLLIRDRAGAREQVGRIVDWGAERLILGHGDTIGSNATEVIERAYRWL